MEKLAPATRFKLAIMLNKLRPLAVAYDQAHAQAAKNANVQVDGKAPDPITAHANLLAEISALRAEEHDINLPTLLKTELKMEENPKVNGMALSQVLPVIEGLDSI